MSRQIQCFFLLILFVITPTLYAINSSYEKQINFLNLTDIHFDPFAACQTTPCALAQTLRNTPASEWANTLAKHDKTMPGYGQDTNYALLHSSLDAAKNLVIKNKIQFVLILGDFLRHDFRRYYKYYSNDKSFSGYQAFVKKTFAFLNLEFLRAFPNIDVYPLIGNNDSNRGDYFSQARIPFYRELALDWAKLMRGQNQKNLLQEFPIGGYYAINAPNNSHLRIILLNSVMFSNWARGKNVAAAAWEQLAWLKKELQMVKANKQKAIIAMHIPPGIDVYATLRIRLFRLVELWQPEYRELFENDLQEYAANIVAMFAGHLHSDWFQIMGFRHAHEQIPMIGTPAISPIFRNNPSFKMYSYAQDTGKLEDFVTYYYSLIDKKNWHVEYNFRQIYLPNCGKCSVLDGINSIKQANRLADYYKKFYAVNTNSEPITKKWKPYYWCAIHQLNAKYYKKCIQ